MVWYLNKRPNKRNNQISIAPILIFLHYSGENICGYLICSDPLDDKLIKALQSGVKEKIAKLLQEGRRAMIGEDFQASLQPLSECCHLITTNFGEMDPQLAGLDKCHAE